MKHVYQKKVVFFLSFLIYVFNNHDLDGDFISNAIANVLMIFFYANIVYDNIVTSYSMLLFCSEPAGSCCKELALLPNKNIWVKLIT